MSCLPFILRTAEESSLSTNQLSITNRDNENTNLHYLHYITLLTFLFYWSVKIDKRLHFSRLFLLGRKTYHSAFVTFRSSSFTYDWWKCNF
jgi:hypothetical protein